MVMAQKVNIVLVDDIDGSEAEETVPFSLDGRDFEIDLNAHNAQKLRDALAPYVGHARRAGGGRSSRRATKSSGSSSSGNGASPAEIRQWARENGWEVPERGRVATEVREAYAAAH
jgi:Lsr2